MAEGLATRSSRGHRTICLPIAEDADLQAVNDPVAFLLIRGVGGSETPPAGAATPSTPTAVPPTTC